MLTEEILFRSNCYCLPLLTGDGEAGRYNPLIDAVFVPWLDLSESDQLKHLLFGHERIHHFLSGTKSVCDLRQVAEYIYGLISVIWVRADQVELKGQTDHSLAESSISEHLTAAGEAQQVMNSLFELSRATNEMLTTGLWLYDVERNLALGSRVMSTLKRRIYKRFSDEEVDLIERFLRVETRIGDHRWDFAACVLDFPILEILYDSRGEPCEWNWINDRIQQIRKCEVPIFIPTIRLQQAIEAIEHSLHIGMSLWSSREFRDYMCKAVPAVLLADRYIGRCLARCWAKPLRQLKEPPTSTTWLHSRLMAEICDLTCHNLVAERYESVAPEDHVVEQHLEPTYTWSRRQLGKRRMGEVLGGSFIAMGKSFSNYTVLPRLESLRQQMFAHAPLKCFFSTIGCRSQECGDVALFRQFWDIVGLAHDPAVDPCATSTNGT